MEFAGMFEAYSRTLGHSGKLLTRHYRLEGFPFHVLSGKTGGFPASWIPPSAARACPRLSLRGRAQTHGKNEPILVDFGTLLDGYHIDESRMFVMGKMADKARDACLASIEILFAVREKMAPGVALGEVFETAVQKAEGLSLKDQFLGLPGLKSRFIGHGIGLELVENPVLARGRKEVLKPGMVFAVEPKCIFKDEFAAGIESMIHVTETGSRFLSLTENKIFSC
nr:aminopeptidase P family protein [Desulfobacula sp.]